MSTYHGDCRRLAVFGPPNRQPEGIQLQEDFTTGVPSKTFYRHPPGSPIQFQFFRGGDPWIVKERPRAGDGTVFIKSSARTLLTEGDPSETEMRG